MRIKTLINLYLTLYIRNRKERGGRNPRNPGRSRERESDLEKERKRENLRALCKSLGNLRRCYRILQTLKLKRLPPPCLTENGYELD